MLEPFAGEDRKVCPSNKDDALDTIADIVASARKKGVALWLDRDRLRYKAPKGVLTSEELHQLRRSADRIVMYLASEPFSLDPMAGGMAMPVRRSPSTFAQIAHWNQYRLHERAAIRQIASATRLQGRLDFAALKRSLGEVVARHDALRTQIVVRDGVLLQEVHGRRDFELTMTDLSVLAPECRDTAVLHRIERLILQPIDVAVDPLFGAELLRVRDDEHVLVLVMEHMISDAASMNIVLQELAAAYEQISTSGEVLLPPVRLQYSNYAVRQANNHGIWIARHGAHWESRLSQCEHVPFPGNKEVDAVKGWGTVPVRIGREMKQRLQQWCRARRTTLVMAVFTAYAALVLRWCNQRTRVIRFQSDGRFEPEAETAIGFFASALYLRIWLHEDASFVDFLNSVMDEYCMAHEHADCSYMAAQIPKPQFTRSTAFNWVPQIDRLSAEGHDRSLGMITWSPMEFSHPMLRHMELDHEPGILLYDTGHQIVGYVHYPMNRFSRDAMEQFAGSLMIFLDTMLKIPECRIGGVSLLAPDRST